MPFDTMQPPDGWKLHDRDRGQRNLQALRTHLGDRFTDLLGLLQRFLPRCADPDMALNSLERYFAQPAALEQLPTLLEGRGRHLDALLRLLSTSQFFADTLCTHPDFIDLIRSPSKRLPSPTPDELRQQLNHELDACKDDASVLRAFRRFRQRHLLRIGISDIIHDRPLEEVTWQISELADVSVDTALRWACRSVTARFGEPFTEAGTPARLCVLGFGKLGGSELNYSSDIDLMFLYDAEGETRSLRGRGISNQEFFGRVVSETIRLLAAPTDRGVGYRVDLRLRPEGDRGPLARSLDSTLQYYDTLGRTWERQALIKVRPIAGDLELGAEFLHKIEPFVWRKYLSYAEINEIKAIKRRIERKTQQSGTSEREVKTGRGGIRDIEFTVQFLQLLNGGDLPELRQRNTLDALHALEQAGCLTDQEAGILEDGYRFLRKIEHRLQLLFDWQTHQLPESVDELQKLALRMGYTDAEIEPPPGRLPTAPVKPSEGSGTTPFAQKRSPFDEPSPGNVLDTRDLLHDPLEKFLHDYHAKTDRNRSILDHLLHQTFAGGDQSIEPESDLVLIPDPDEAMIRSVLARYRFRDIPLAYQNLMQLASENVPFLSTRRCRHFLASIAPQLLQAVAETPDPDRTLLQLEKVSHSLGAKAILWELFSFNPPSLRLYVDLCANSPFLSEILINNPGMIDELLDSLVLNQPRTLDELRTELTELCRGATDLEPILHSFQDKETLRVGVRDLLGKDDIRQTTEALSDIAETILQAVFRHQERHLLSRCGQPMLSNGRSGQPSRYAVLALGRLGGREMTYQSDIDLLMIYEGDGSTGPAPDVGSSIGFVPSDNYHCFTQLTQRVIRMMSQMGPMGRLYAVDMRLRPTGGSGSLVIPLQEFERYFHSGEAQLWERQALLRARVVHGDADFAETVASVVRRSAIGLGWQPKYVDEIRSMRSRLQASANERSLKRCAGGTMDVDFLVQYLQLRHGNEHPAILQTNNWEALRACREAQILHADDYAILTESYSFLRLAEGRLRIVENRALTEFPESPEDQRKLARRLGFASETQLLSEIQRHTSRIREVYERLLR